jgi:iron-sulfur cluster assembly protein
MLTLTPMAAAAVRKLVTDAAITGEDGGLRITPGEASESGPGLALSVVASPLETDRLVEADGAYVFLEPSVAGLLDDKLLDATLETGRVRFVLFDRGDVPPQT